MLLLATVLVLVRHSIDVCHNANSLELNLC